MRKRLRFCGAAVALLRRIPLLWPDHCCSVGILAKEKQWLDEMETGEPGHRSIISICSKEIARRDNSLCKFGVMQGQHVDSWVTAIIFEWK
jgi:hypothetical protein